uniref:Mitochondrial carrier protein n=1 Tax=Rhodosorus marinus TaxID=101924 RepID=A0A7S3A1G4_9RHOD|mmetsp:Transcript_39391/g.156454  ORF Transcript_39391/g.156454 Transcript_39391/m.156454 type:complete len:326 (+) Transcript_39391:146-1123(+)
MTNVKEDGQKLVNPVEVLAEAVKTFQRVMVNSQDHVIAAAVARAVSIAAMFPVDTLKTRLQASTGQMKNPLTVIFSEGNPYRGLLPSLAGQTPYGMLVFGSYQVYKEMFQNFFPQMGDRTRIVLAAVFGDITGSLWLCPSEVIKQQQQSGLYASFASAFQGALKQSGVAGLYKGYSGLVVRDVPFRVVQLVMYEECKKFWKERNKRETNDIENLVLGAVAGMVGGAATTPLDVVKTRLMTQGSTRTYKGALDCVKQTVQAEGIPGLFRGVGPRVLLIAPSCAIFFVAYEATIRALKRRSAERKNASISPVASASRSRGYQAPAPC